jgi:hypothetical protein
VIGAMPILLNAAFAPIHWAKRAIDRKHNEEFDFWWTKTNLNLKGRRISARKSKAFHAMDARSTAQQTMDARMMSQSAWI